MTHIHPTALVDPKAELAADVVVGPYSIIEEGVVLGPGCVVEPFATLKKGTVAGANNRFGQSCIIGGEPQDAKFHGEDSGVLLGEGNTLREFATVHRATGEGLSTTIGNNCFFMAFVHIGHNGSFGNGITVANSVNFAGHCQVEDNATVGGMTGFHQFVRVGRLAMVAAMGRINMDAPPFMITGGMDQSSFDINAVGLRRAGVSQATRTALHKACKLLYRSQIATGSAIEIVRREVDQVPEVVELLEFVEFTRGGKNGRGLQR